MIWESVKKGVVVFGILFLWVSWWGGERAVAVKLKSPLPGCAGKAASTHFLRAYAFAWENPPRARLYLRAADRALPAGCAGWRERTAELRALLKFPADGGETYALPPQTLPAQP